MDTVGDPACRRVRAAALLQWTGSAVVFTRAVVDAIAFRNNCRQFIEVALSGTQCLACRAAVFIMPLIPQKVAAREGAIFVLGLVPDRYMRRDMFFLDQPTEHVSCPVPCPPDRACKTSGTPD